MKFCFKNFIIGDKTGYHSIKYMRNDERFMFGDVLC